MFAFILAMYIAMANGVHVPVGIQVIVWVLMVLSVIADILKAFSET